MNVLINKILLLLVCFSLIVGCSSTNDISPAEKALGGIEKSVRERERNLPEEHKTGKVTKRDAEAGLFRGMFFAFIKLLGSE